MKPFLCTLSALMMLVTGTAHAAAPASAKETIEAFYKKYLAQIHVAQTAVMPPFSKAFKKAWDENTELCKKYGEGDICGWAADGDPYIDAQDFDDKLTYANSQIAYREDKPDTVAVSLNLFPSDPKLAKQSTRTITYKMVQEDGKWMVDDILDNGGKDSARKAMAAENASMRKGH